MSTAFAHLGLPDSLVQALARRKIVEPFPVQEATIPDALAGKDVSGKAPTGSGKTLAFGLPLLTKVEKAGKNRPTALILAPTRELAEQIKMELAPLARAAHRQVIAIYGGVSYGPQKGALRKGVDVLVATPGRLEDLMEQGSVDLSRVTIAVVDEADRMADMGFLPAVRRILDRTSRKRQTLLFSATLDGDIAVLSRDYQRDPVRHDAGTVEPETIDARHHFWLVDHHDRVEHAADLIEAAGRSIVFTRTRHGADRLAQQLKKFGVKAVAMHGGRSQNQRKRALHEFSSGRVPALIATDVAARGIHIDAVESVVHFDPPADYKDYLHRSGRTARAGATGTVVSLVTGGQRREVLRMQRDLNLQAPIEEPRFEDLLDGGHRIGEPSADGQRRRSSSRNGSRRPSERSSRRNGRNERTPRFEREERTPRFERDERTPRFERDERTPRFERAERPQKKRSRAGKGGESVYIANLPWGATDDDVHKLFGRYGTVNQATVITDKRTGRSKGFGFVDMPKPAAQTAIKALHGSILEGRDLTVRFAQPRTYGG